MKRFVSTWATLLAIAMLAGASATHAADIKVMSSLAVKSALLDLMPAFESSSGHKVTIIWASGPAITKRISDGEVADIVLVPRPGIDKLMAEGKLVAGSRSDVAKSGIGVAVRAGLPKPDISSGEAVRKTVLAARSVAYSSGASGIYIANLFKQWGIADQIKDKVKQTPGGVQVGDVLARGEADLGFQQVSELLNAPGIHYLGPLPADIQQFTVFSAGLHTAATAPDAAKALLKFLAAPEAAAAFRKAGMEPG